MAEWPVISEKRIQQWLGSIYSARGKSYFQQGHVLQLEMDDGLLMAKVRGGGVTPYQVHVRFGNHEALVSSCSCPIGGECKHVAAALYAWMEEQDGAHEEQAAVAAPAPFAFAQWLGALDQVRDGKPSHDEFPDSTRQRLLFILHQDGERNVRLQFIVARMLKGGGYGKATPYNAANILGSHTPQYILSSDERILREVAMDRSLGSLHGYRLQGEDGLRIFKRVVASGRCHWQSKEAPAIRQGEKRHGEWRWQLDGRGDQYLTLAMSAEEIVVPTSPPWYLDLHKGVCGPIESGQPASVAEILLNMPAVELDCADEVLASVNRQLPGAVPAPHRLLHEHRRVRPLPLLRLTTIRPETRWSYRNPEQFHVASLYLDYDGMRVPYTSSPKSIRSIRGDRVIDFSPDSVAHAEAVDALSATGLFPLQEHRTAAAADIDENHFILTDDDQWPDWMLYETPTLEEQGFRVEVMDDFPYRMETAKNWHLQLAEGGGSRLMGQAMFTATLHDGEEVDLIDVLARWVGSQPNLLSESSLASIREQASIALPMPGGRFLAAPGEAIANILHYMLDLFASGSGAEAKLSVPQMLALEKQFEGGDVQVSTTAWLRQMRQLADIGSVPDCTLPVGLKATLRDYQHEGVNWMQMLCRMQLAGILADDMGLGKTIQALTHILIEKEEGRLQQPALVIAPTSLMHNWRREAGKFTPDLSVLVLHGPDRALRFGEISSHDVVLTTYPLLVRDFEVLEAQPWHLLILDEAQYIKNAGSKAAQRVRRLHASHKLCMTGTPMENHLGELWAQFDFLMPGYLHDKRLFSRVFRKPIELQGDQARQEALHIRVRPFLLRRSKDQVALELPPKTEIIRSVEMEGAQRELYESVRLAMQKRVRDAVASMGVAQSQIVVLDALMKMRQVCCDPRLMSGLQVKPPASAKLAMLLEMLPEMIEEGRQILLFSQFTSMLKLIEEAVSGLGIEYVKLTGQTRDRELPVERFQRGEVPLFLISLKAGGVGLNLTAADTVIHYDPWWNPAVEAQATDRAHRIGQDKAVFVYKLLTEGTVEERILEMQERKRELANIIQQQGGGQAPLWTPEDMESLFAPLS
ncbi:DNA/RNA helicase [Mariprofundus erugo]|uniref:DNA/RNA helicase n=1 Tax=Mariprofundus erugo TaxID=2528639 RepID=A0A5R9GTC3_9PROT|nr:DEAD/DEAH box helicase [Mariprofundus erugo]TLS69140.1 DNA/RNA helicase [Mariprofundus erugo]